MAKQTDPSESADWVREKLAALRANLEKGEGWPASADRLLDDLRAAGQEPEPLTDEDMALVSLVLGDALLGVDVAVRYPRFFEKLLANEGLRDAFLDGLILLEETETLAPPGSAPTAGEASPLGFLRTAKVRPEVEAEPGGGWRAQWRQLKETLDWLLRPERPAAGLAWRSGEEVMDEGYRTLLRSEAMVGEQMLYLTLDGRQLIEKPDVLELLLMVAAEEGEVGPLKATLQWGDYEDKAVLDEQGEALFAPVPLDIVWQAGVTGDLRLTLESVMRDA
jgi:hypothetical protein